MTTILGVLDRPREQTTVLYVLTCFREVEIPISEVQLSDIQPEAGRAPFLVAGKPCWKHEGAWALSLQETRSGCRFMLVRAVLDSESAHAGWLGVCQVQLADVQPEAAGMRMLRLSTGLDQEGVQELRTGSRRALLRLRAYRL